MRGRSWLIAIAVGAQPGTAWAAGPTPSSKPSAAQPASATVRPGSDAAHGLAGTPAAPEGTTTRWEYRVITYDRVAMFSDSDHDMRMLGLMGWELVGVTYDPNARTIVCFFKRPLR